MDYDSKVLHVALEDLEAEVFVIRQLLGKNAGKKRLERDYTGAALAINVARGKLSDLAGKLEAIDATLDYDKRMEAVSKAPFPTAFAA